MIDYQFTALGRLISASKSADAPLEALVLHGAGKATRHRSQWIAEFLEKHGTGCISFDFIGHGQTGGEMQGTTLAMRRVQAEVAADQLDRRKAVIGFSMGGHIAIDIACDQEFGSLILFCPAIYPDSAWQAPFGDIFSKEIRKPDAWMSSTALKKLSSYKGRIMVIIGDRDTVIPNVLPESIQEAATLASSVRIHRVPGADHYLLGYLLDNTSAREKVLDLVYRTIKGD